MKLFKKHLASTKRRAEEMDELQHQDFDDEFEGHDEDDDYLEGAKDGFEAGLEVGAEALDDEEDEDEGAWRGGSRRRPAHRSSRFAKSAPQSRRRAAEEEGEEGGELPDKVVKEVAKECKTEIEDLIDAVGTELEKTEASAKVKAAVIAGLNANHIFVKSNSRFDLRRAKFTKAEKRYVTRIVDAAVETVEDILRVATATLIKYNRRSAKYGRQLDKILLREEYVKSRVAAPVPRRQLTASKSSTLSRRSSERIERRPVSKSVRRTRRI